MVPSGRTTRSSLVTNDASAWYLTVGLACGRHLRRIRWRAAAGGSNVYALGVSCNCKRESLRCRTGLAAVMRQSSQARGGLSWRSEETAVAGDVGRCSDQAIVANTLRLGHWTVGGDHVAHQRLLFPVVLLQGVLWHCRRSLLSHLRASPAATHAQVFGQAIRPVLGDPG